MYGFDAGARSQAIAENNAEIGANQRLIRRVSPSNAEMLDADARAGQKKAIGVGDVINFMPEANDLDQLKKFKNAAMSLISQSAHRVDRGYWASERTTLDKISGYDLTAGFHDTPDKLKITLEAEQLPPEPRSMQWVNVNEPEPQYVDIGSSIPCNLSKRAIEYAPNSWGADMSPTARLKRPITITTTYTQATLDQECAEVLRRYEEAKTSLPRRNDGVYRTRSPRARSLSFA